MRIIIFCFINYNKMFQQWKTVGTCSSVGSSPAFRFSGIEGPAVATATRTKLITSRINRFKLWKKNYNICFVVVKLLLRSIFLCLQYSDMEKNKRKRFWNLLKRYEFWLSCIDHIIDAFSIKKHNIFKLGWKSHIYDYWVKRNVMF